MPRAINPFSSSQNLDASSESHLPRRSSLSKANQKLQSLFTSNAKKNTTDAAALQAANNAQLAYFQSSTSINPASLSLPSISLSTAVGEKSRYDGTTTLFSPPSPAEARNLKRQHAEFGPLTSNLHKYKGKFAGSDLPDPIEDEPPYYIMIITYLSYLMLIIVGHIRDFWGKRFKKHNYTHLMPSNGYAALNTDFDNFYVRRLKLRLNDCFARPITGVPGRFITLMDRETDDFYRTFRFTGGRTETLNLSSYNYLGFAQSEGACADAVETSIRKWGISTCSPRADVGTTELHLEAEQLLAEFVGKESAMLFSMGFSTNATVFPALVGKGSLVISDEFNHSSIRTGMRLSGAVVRTFKHNDMGALERVLREAISQGQPRTRRPWKKILVTIEGLYSMEGTMCNLPAVIRLKKKYKFYLFVDEAHSIGALGPRARGVCDYFNVDPGEVDVLMGTLTKSFGANGGYIAADKVIIDKLRATNAGTIYGETPAPPCVQQIITSLKIINGDLAPGQGDERLQRIAFNSRYLRLGLKRLGFIVYGHDDSPIVPLLLYTPGKMPAFSREMLKRKISVVVVGYPATPLTTARARFCVSAAHTKEDMDRVLTACDEVGDLLDLKLSSGIAGGLDLPSIEDSDAHDDEDMQMTPKKPVAPPRWKLQDVLAKGVHDVQFPLR